MNIRHTNLQKICFKIMCLCNLAKFRQFNSLNPLFLNCCDFSLCVPVTVRTLQAPQWASAYQAQSVPKNWALYHLPNQISWPSPIVDSIPAAHTEGLFNNRISKYCQKYFYSFFFIAAINIYDKLSCLQQHLLIISQFWRSEVQGLNWLCCEGITGAAQPGSILRPREENQLPAHMGQC